LRLRSGVGEFTVVDDLHGPYRGRVDDFVLRRGDGTPAYNLAVVVDDAEQGIDQVVRGDDLLPSTPRQAYLATLLEVPVPHYAHVPLVLNRDGNRLAKRDGAVTLADRAALGESPGQVLELLAQSLGYTGSTPGELLEQFRPAALPRAPWVLDPIGTAPGRTG
jgi:glutamyl-tRNA synthetase